MADRFAGVAYVTVNGSPVPVRGGLTVHAARFNRTGIAGQDGVHGYSEVPVVPAIELDISATEDISAEDIQALTDATVIAETASGKTYTLRNAWKAGVFDLNAAEGSVRVRFEGMDIQEYV